MIEFSRALPNSIGRQTMFLFALPLCFEVILLFALVSLLLQANRRADELENSQAVLSCVSQLNKSLFLMPMSAVASVTPGVHWSGPSAKESVKLWHSSSERLCHLLRERYPEEFVTELQALFHEIDFALDQISIESFSNPLAILHPSSSALRLQSRIEEASQTCRQIVEREKEAAAGLPENTRGCYRYFITVIGLGFVANLFFAALLVAFIFLRIVRPLHRIQSSLRRFESGGAYRDSAVAFPEEDKVNEIGQLDAVFEKVTGELAASLYRDRSLLQNAADPILWIDADTLAVIDCNSAAVSILVHDGESIAGRCAMDFTGDSDLLKSALVSRRNQILELKMISAKDSEFDALASVQNVAGFNEMMCIVHDVTQRKAREQKQRMQEARITSILDSMFVAVLVVDSALLIESCNKTAEDMLGRSQADLKGKHLTALIPPGCFGADMSKSDLLNELYMRELEMVTAHGTEISVTMCVAKISGESKDKFVINLLDNTEQRQSEKLRQWLLNMISHDLRTPLASILSSLDLLLSGTLGDVPKNGQKTLLSASAELDGLIDLINDLLALEKVTSGSLALDMKILTIGGLVGSVIGLRNSKYACLAHIEERIAETFVNVDERQLVAAFDALLAWLQQFAPGQCHVEAGLGKSLTITFRAPATDNELALTISQILGLKGGYKNKVILLAMLDVGLARAAAIIALQKGELGLTCNEFKTEFVVNLQFIEQGRSS
jgi:PAS domain S-box-containing protein